MHASSSLIFYSYNTFINNHKCIFRLGRVCKDKTTEESAVLFWLWSKDLFLDSIYVLFLRSTIDLAYFPLLIYVVQLLFLLDYYEYLAERLQNFH